ncbi:MAG: XdhC/CoxI family protein [Tissierellia bacterium]|nr:XdhC/CoxI family protein [Tissierellia bacterium]
MSSIIRELSKRIDENKKTALVILTKNTGSSPGVEGEIMLVYPDGKSLGTIGGGSLEYNVIKKVMENMESCENFNFKYDLAEGGDIGMLCGGDVEGYVKFFKPSSKLIIFGAGHVAKALNKAAKELDFNISIVDDRQEYLSDKSFENANKICCPFDRLSDDIDYDNSYIVIMTPSHSYDYEVLRAVVEKNYKYLGLMGSGKKVNSVKRKLNEDGVSQENIDKVRMPIGINIATGTPQEIAISICAELLACRNNIDEVEFLSDKHRC